jgi:mannosyltransferase
VPEEPHPSVDILRDMPRTRSDSPPDVVADRPSTVDGTPTHGRLALVLGSVFVGIVGTVVSFWGAWTAPAGIDEAATMSAARRSLPELWHMAHNVDGVHSLYYAFVHVWFRFLPYDLATLRFPSAVAAGVAAALLVVLVSRLTTLRAGLIAGLVLAVLPRTTSSGLQGRSYAMSIAVAVVLTLVFVVATDRSIQRRRRAWLWWLGYTVVAVFGSALFLYSALLVVAHACTMLIWQLTRRRQGATGRAGLSWLVAAVAAAAGTVPIVLLTSGQAQKQLYWIGTTLSVDGRLANSVFVLQYFGLSTVLAVVSGVLALVGIVAVLVLRRLRPWTAAIEIALPAVVLPTVIVVVVSVLVQPLYNSRYLTFTTPFVAVLVGLGLAAVRWRTVSVAGVVVFAVVAAPQIAQQKEPDHKTGSHWRDVAAYVAAERERLPDVGGVDGVYYGPLPGHPIRTTEYVSSSYPAPFRGLRDVTLVRTAADVGELWADRSPATAIPRLRGVDRVWYVGATTAEQPAAVGDRLEAHGWRVETRHRVDDFAVVTYIR